MILIGCFLDMAGIGAKKKEEKENVWNFPPFHSKNRRQSVIALKRYVFK